MKIPSFFPVCPQCGSGNVNSLEDGQFDHAAQMTGARLTAQAMMGSPHPAAKAAVTAIVFGRAIWKRWPGGGAKVCADCGHQFR
ncbi:MAG: hypothetical protein V4808_12465 [Pseudomonadota bacterium]